MSDVREKTRQRHQQAVEDFYENGLSRSALMKKYGYSEASIKKMLKEDRVRNGPRERKVQPKDPRARERIAISFEHYCVGIHVSNYMKENDIPQTMFGMLGDLALSRVDVGELMVGCYDFTWTEMKALSRVLGLNHDELISPNPQRMEREEL